jgi:membrane associated rhomboid family serine protease
MTADDYRVVYQGPNRADCADRALVLTAAGIPHQVVHDDASSAILVPAEFSIAAGDELRAYEEENPRRRPPPKPDIRYHDAVPGVAAYFLVVCVVAGLAGRAAFGLDWRAAGRIDGALLRDGEWWRTITALTLHADLEHLVGNLVFGLFFGWFAGRLVGSGVAWLTIVLAGALGNLVNTLLLDPSHRAIGASTAVFAALGLMSGFVWKSKFMAQDRWGYRYGPIVGGLALLMFTGTGDENTDIGAHLMGFATGFGSGVLLSTIRDYIDVPARQKIAGTTAALLVVVAWAFAFHA